MSDEQENDMTLEVLQAGRKLIAKKDGWCQGDYHNADGAHCAIGAVWEGEATLLTGGSSRAEHLLNRATRQITHRKCGVIWYNDRPRTTQKKIVRVFDRAIELAKKERI